MTIRDARRNCWRKVDEAESASEANPTAELCHWRGARFTPCSKGRAENCANVRHADLRLGKGQSRRQKAIRLFNLVRYSGLRKLACSVDLFLNAFLLEAAEERLCDHIVPAGSATAHARFNMISFVEPSANRRFHIASLGRNG